jgi:hypothetical protein
LALASLVLLHLLVRVDAAAAIKPAMIGGIVAEARRIWKPYGVDVTFALPHGIETSEPDEEIRLLITDRLPPGTRGHGDVASLGWIEFLSPEQPASAITVSIAAALKLSDGVNWMERSFDRLPIVIQEQFLTRALGRAAAHEIGHYLLRSTVHARGGLMRSQFPADEMMDPRLTRFRLEPSQVELLDRRQPAIRAGQQAALSQ